MCILTYHWTQACHELIILLEDIYRTPGDVKTQFLFEMAWFCLLYQATTGKSNITFLSGQVSHNFLLSTLKIIYLIGMHRLNYENLRFPMMYYMYIYTENRWM